jgi:hypothetical protein
MRDSMYDDVAARLTLPPAARTNGVVNGTAVDTQGARNFFRVAMLVVSAGVITDGTQVIAVQDSDDGTTNWLPFGGQVQGSIPTLGTPQGTAVYRLALDTLPRRWLRANVTVAGATTGGLVSAVFMLAEGSGRAVS